MEEGGVEPLLHNVWFESVLRGRGGGAGGAGGLESESESSAVRSIAVSLDAPSDESTATLGASAAFFLEELDGLALRMNACWMTAESSPLEVPVFLRGFLTGLTGSFLGGFMPRASSKCLRSTLLGRFPKL